MYCPTRAICIENRVRLVKEIIEDTREAVGDTCAVAVRMAADDGTGTAEHPVSEERKAMFEILAELPDCHHRFAGDRLDIVHDIF